MFSQGQLTFGILFAIVFIGVIIYSYRKDFNLHQKYYKVYTTEKLLLRKLEADLKIYQQIKYEYYAGELAEEDLREHGWEPFPKKVLRADIPRHVDSDRQVIERTLKIAHQKEKVDFCDAIIKSLRDRGFLIKSAIDWRKFTNGAI